MIRLLLYAIAGFFGYHFFKGLFGSDKSDANVRGRQKQSDLDLNQEDVQDAKYKDIDSAG